MQFNLITLQIKNTKITKVKFKYKYCEGDDIVNFCSNCGNKLSYDSRFCPKCGIELNNVQSGPTVNHTSQSQATKEISKKSWIGMVICILILLLVILPIYKVNSKKPEKVVYKCMQSCYNGDVDLLLQHISTQHKLEIIEDLDLGIYTKRDMQDDLRYLNKELVASVGPDWLKQLKLETISADKNTAIVRVSHYENFYDVQLIKENGKWKLFDLFDFY